MTYNMYLPKGYFLKTDMEKLSLKNDKSFIQ